MPHHDHAFYKLNYLFPSFANLSQLASREISSYILLFLEHIFCWIVFSNAMLTQLLTQKLVYIPLPPDGQCFIQFLKVLTHCNLTFHGLVRLRNLCSLTELSQKQLSQNLLKFWQLLAALDKWGRKVVALLYTFAKQGRLNGCAQLIVFCDIFFHISKHHSSYQSASYLSQLSITPCPLSFLISKIKNN